MAKRPVEFNASLDADRRNDFPWVEVYRQEFSGIAEILDLWEDKAAQKSGIDRVIVFEDGVRLTIDEKTRQGSGVDVPLEFWSAFEKKALGWVADPGHKADVLAIAYKARESVDFYPFWLVKQAWARKHPEWTKKFRVSKVPNRDKYDSSKIYHTHVCFVPPEVLRAAVLELTPEAPENYRAHLRKFVGKFAA